MDRWNLRPLDTEDGFGYLSYKDTQALRFPWIASVTMSPSSPSSLRSTVFPISMESSQLCRPSRLCRPDVLYHCPLLAIYIVFLPPSVGSWQQQTDLTDIVHPAIMSFSSFCHLVVKFPAQAFITTAVTLSRVKSAVLKGVCDLSVCG